jgi:hypothetical protein
MSGAERAVKTTQQDQSSRLYHLELRDRLAECSSKFHALLHIAGFWNPSTHLYCDQTDGRVLSAAETSVVRELHAMVSRSSYKARWQTNTGRFGCSSAP